MIVSYDIFMETLVLHLKIPKIEEYSEMNVVNNFGKPQVHYWLGVLVGKYPVFC